MVADGKHKNMIDLVLIDKRWKTVLISSEHSLVMCNVQLRLMRRKINQNQKALKVDIEALSVKATRD